MIAWFCWLLVRLFPSRSRVVPTANDPSRPLLLQFRILPLFAGPGKSATLYLQHFINPEPEGIFHRHRWERMRSRVLSGYFVEQRPHDDGSAHIAHWAGSTYTMDRSVIHRVAYWSPDCWTLFRMSREQSDDWGYYVRDAFGELSAQIPWREFIQERVPSLDTGAIS